MAQGSTIEWTGSTWNPVVGCSKVSSGCAHCYAERMAKRLSAISQSARRRGANPGRTGNYESVIGKDGKWNGTVYLDHGAVDDPRGWKLPRVVFVNSMSDLFHDDVPLEFIQRVFRVMNDCPQHTFQVLTKRPHRTAELGGELNWSQNIWMGTSVENIEVIDRVRQLQRVPAKVRFLSAEPLLGPLPRLPLRGIDWVIVGGESGPGARPMAPEWATQIRDRCEARGVAFFFKQWGGVNKKKAGRELEGKTWDEMPPQLPEINSNGVRTHAA